MFWCLNFRRMIFAIRLFIFNCCCKISNVHSPDERSYTSWTISQVASWSYSQLRKQLNTTLNHHHSINESRRCYEEEYYQQQAIHYAIVALRKQGVDGKSLSHLKLDHLVNNNHNFRMQFGVAVCLMACIDELIPDRCIHDENNKKKLGREEDLLPSWYRTDEATANGGDNSIDQEGIELSEQAQQIMQDRFGLSLPTLRGSSDVTPSNSSEESIREIQRNGHAIEIPQDRKLPSAYSIEQQQHMDHTIDDDIMNAMPPHVREVAKRNPGLVSKLLLERRQRIQHTNKSASLPLEEEEKEDNAYHSEEDINIDQESTSLLRRRTNNSKDISQIV